MSAAAEVAVIVIAKEPRPGRCKTRLAPPLTEVEAARVARAALGDTLRTVAAAGCGRRVLALDGDRGPWLPSGFEVVPQASGDLGRRLASAFAAVGGPALLIGMDTPQLTSAAVEAAAARLADEGIDAVLGPAADGGYWAIGLREARAEVFDGVEMSSPRTARMQRARLRALGLRFADLEPLRDFDTFDDARRVAELCPGTEFARELAALPCAATC
jgi:rSAM/selenodomain-associated transferase 1